MNRVATALSIAFGYMFVALSLFVTAETIMRKLFNVSFQGADELGGYALAVGSSLAFSIAWLGVFRHGPLEWVWRSLAYRRRQRFLR